MTENHENHENCLFFYMWDLETSATLPKLLRNLGFDVGKVNETFLPQIVGFTAQEWPKMAPRGKYFIFLVIFDLEHLIKLYISTPND